MNEPRQVLFDAPRIWFGADFATAQPIFMTLSAGQFDDLRAIKKVPISQVAAHFKKALRKC